MDFARSALIFEEFEIEFEGALARNGPSEVIWHCASFIDNSTLGKLASVGRSYAAIVRCLQPWWCLWLARPADKDNMSSLNVGTSPRIWSSLTHLINISGRAQGFHRNLTVVSSAMSTATRDYTAQMARPLCASLSK